MQDNIKIAVGEVRCECMNWMYLVRVRFLWWQISLLNSKNGSKFL